MVLGVLVPSWNLLANFSLLLSVLRKQAGMERKALCYDRPETEGPSLPALPAVSQLLAHCCGPWLCGFQTG